jgi:DNA polymerase III subunit alpha
MSETKNFIHLRTHSSYSLLEGAIQVSDLIATCTKNKIPAVAITDKDNLFASLEFSMQASAAGVQPIIGAVFKFNPQSPHDSDTSKDDKNIDEVLLIAKNKQGYNNLLKLASEYHSPDYLEHISFDQLSQYSEGLILLTCGQYGTIGRLLLNNKLSLAEECLLKLNSIFKDHLYIELMRHGLPEEEAIEQHFIDLGLRHNIPFVATNNVCFLDKGMQAAHDVLLCISGSRYLTEEDRRKSNSEYYFKSANEMQKLFEDIPEAIENTVTIAKRCSVKAEEHPIIFPQYDISIGESEEEELRILAARGFEKRLEQVNILNPKTGTEKEKRDQIYKDRLEYELDIIIKMKFASYFLIVFDFIRWAKDQNIPVGPGRGSGAGSVVSWSLDITDVDPIKFGLLFERFLNPERVSMPDLDIDFCQERRDEVIKYVYNKYGKERVAHIITFGKLQARAVIRDVGRVLQLPYSVVDRIAKMVPFNAINPVTLAQAIEIEAELKKAKEQDPQIDQLLNISLKLEGLHRHASTHAAGVVISGKNLDQVVPMYKNSKSGMSVIQYSMKYAEAAGLIKFDFLGLKTLTVLSKCQKLIKKTNTDFDHNKIPLNDYKSFEMLSKGQSIGVFQLESAGMRSALSKMKPDSIEDIIALGALYRPGPMDNIPAYIDCKQGKAEPNYLHPKLENTLKKTFGIVIYQEQVIEIARVLAGYSLGEADLLRRAMGKKIKKEMDAQREIFVKGAINNGIKKEQAINIFDLVAKFAGYGFPRAHAVAYGVISYQTAYLKANYTAEFITSILNTEIDDTDKLNHFIGEIKIFKIEIISPDINKSMEEFSITEEGGNKKILYALGAIKNVSFDVMKAVREEREQNGLYSNIFDFVARVGNTINKRQLEHLIKAGAFDSIANNRKQLFDSLAILISYCATANDDKNSNQISLFNEDSALYKPSLISTEEWPNNTRLNNECNALGFYLSSHPLDPYSEYFKAIKIFDADYIKNKLKNGIVNAKIAAIPVVIKNRYSPRGRYVFCSMSTPTGMLEVTIFDDQILEENRDSIYSKVPLLIDAEIRKDAEMERITALKICTLEKYLSQQQSKVTITVQNHQILNSLKMLIKKSSDNSIKHAVKLKLRIDNKEVQIALPSDYYLDVTHEQFAKLPADTLSIY